MTDLRQAAEQADERSTSDASYEMSSWQPRTEEERRLKVKPTARWLIASRPIRNLEPANSLRTVGTNECRALHLVLPDWKDGRRDVLVSSNPML